MERAQHAAASHWPAWLNATVLLLASVTAVAALTLQVRPGVEVVAAAFPPWWNARQIFEAAIVRTTALPGILVVRPHDREGLNRLHQAGAWLMIDPQAIAACFNKPDREI